MLLARRALGAACGTGSRGWFSGCFLGSPGAGRVPAGVACGLAEREDRRSNSLIQSVRNYAKISKRKPEFPSQMDDLPPSMLISDYANVEIAASVDDVVKRLLSLEMASQKEKMKVKTEQLVDMMKRDPQDSSSTEVQIAVLTAKIRNFQEHLQKHPKDKQHKRHLLMAIDKRKKLLKHLRCTRYSTFESVCQKLGIQYTFPPEYYRRVTRRWLAKKAFCLKVYQEVKKKRDAEKLNQKKIVEEKARPVEGTAV